MNSSFLGPLAAFMASVTWAFGTIGYSRLARHNSPFAVNLVRSAIGLPLFLLATFAFSDGLSDFSKITNSHLGWFALSTFASYGFGDALFLLSTRSLGVPGALSITATYPLWTALFGYFFKGEVLLARQIGGLAITILGVIVVILTTPNHENSSQRKSLVPGVVLALLTSLLWATNGFAVANGGVGISNFAANTVRMVCGLVLTPLFAKIMMPRASLFLSRTDFKLGLKFFLIETFFGSAFFIYGLSHTSLAIGSTLSSLAPVVAVPIAWVLKTEKVQLPRTFGIIGVAIGLGFLVS